jgi:hypothetical protein
MSDELSDLRRQLADAKAECERMCSALRDLAAEFRVGGLEFAAVRLETVIGGTATTLAKLVCGHSVEAMSRTTSPPPAPPCESP